MSLLLLIEDVGKLAHSAHAQTYRSRMPIRLFAFLVVATVGSGAFAPPRSDAAIAGQTPRSIEMTIARGEMIAPDGSLQSRAAAALERMHTTARDHGARLTVQVPADAFDSASEIRRVAPFASIKRVPPRQPFKLVLRVEKYSDGLQSHRPLSDPGADGPRKDRSDIGSSPQVYIHIRDESQSATAREYAVLLRKLGADVSDVEIIVADGPRRNQLRYFHSGDRQEAATLARGLNGGTELQLLDLSKEYGSSVPVRRYELWLAPRGGSASR